MSQSVTEPASAVEDTCHWILHNGEKLAINPRRDTTPLTWLSVRGKNTQPS